MGGCFSSSLDPYALALPILPDNTGATTRHLPSGNPPSRANVAFRFKLSAPKHVVYNQLTKRKDVKDVANLEVPGLVVHEDGAQGSPWAAMSDGMYGEAPAHFDVFNWSADTPYMHTWRCTKPKLIPMRGVTGSVSVVDGDEPNTCYVLFKAHMDLRIPVPIIARVLKKKFPQVMAPIEQEYAKRGEEMYDGPQPPPTATKDQQPGIEPVEVYDKRKGGDRVAPHGISQ